MWAQLISPYLIWHLPAVRAASLFCVWRIRIRPESTPESEQQIIDSLKWLGLEWDEGPGIGGGNGPYRQSERRAIYAEHAQRLVDKGHAFHCFCTPERLNELRAEQTANKQTPGYDGRCMHLSDEEVKTRLAASQAHVLRMKVPTEGVCVVEDMLRGKIEIDWSQG